MDKSKVFDAVQRALGNVPLILVGTGGTIPYGIPGMKKLADHLLDRLGGKYDSDPVWKDLAAQLHKNVDLESALTDKSPDSALLEDIMKETWGLINTEDRNAMLRLIGHERSIELGKLIHRFYQANPKCVNIITTNYDRMIEYACDQFDIPVDLGFRGHYFGRERERLEYGGRNIVNLLKVHGSLDWYYDSSFRTLSVPLLTEIPQGFLPAIVTPGSGKYKAVLHNPYRDILFKADDLIKNAKNYLCIGYGFNDSQIQQHIINGIREGKPVVAATMELTDKAMKLLTENSDHYVIIQAYRPDNNKTEFILPSGKVILEGQYWTQTGLMDMISS